jgi:hypothetical protein
MPERPQLIHRLVFFFLHSGFSVGFETVRIYPLFPLLDGLFSALHSASCYLLVLAVRGAFTRILHIVQIWFDPLRWVLDPQTGSFYVALPPPFVYYITIHS